ncbi:hypothetical protein RSAG8_02892, partial [Rhizoctonia solani AG-8 WAC10335]
MYTASLPPPAPAPGLQFLIKAHKYQSAPQFIRLLPQVAKHKLQGWALCHLIVDPLHDDNLNMTKSPKRVTDATTGVKQHKGFTAVMKTRGRMLGDTRMSDEWSRSAHIVHLVRNRDHWDKQGVLCWPHVDLRSDLIHDHHCQSSTVPRSENLNRGVGFTFNCFRVVPTATTEVHRFIYLIDFDRCSFV